MEVKLNKSNNNPFFGLKNCLNLTQAATANISMDMLNACWDEVKNDLTKRQMFFSLLFSIGDITSRQHNIFRSKKKDSGGNANREGFYTILTWLWKNHREQYIKFLNAHLFNEYSCFDMLFRNRIKTKKSKIECIYLAFADTEYRKVLLDYVYSIINGNSDFDKLLVAKFLTPPRLSKRSGHKKMLPETRQIMALKAKFLVELSDLMHWEYSYDGKYLLNLKGYRAWRREYNGNLESVLFSTGKIKEFTKEQFIDWFDKLPAQARFRVKNRILYSKTKDCLLNTYEGLGNKWTKFQPWIKEWETYKENKQTEQRVLEEKIRQNQATEDDIVKLKQVKKEAKVNVGATNFKDLYESILKNNMDKLKLESFIVNKVNLPYNTLVLVDDSGSMSGAPFNFASFLASVCLVKNPDDDGRNLLGFFSETGRWFTHIDKHSLRTPNSLIRKGAVKTVSTPFVDPKLSFLDNYNRINSFCRATFRGGWTDISSIVRSLENTLTNNPEVKDALANYPVWTIISDGEWNNCHSPESSLGELFKYCDKYLGFRPFIVAMDVTNSACAPYLNRNLERFTGIDNFIYIPSNPAQIELFLTNFKDMDVFDVYTPLQSIFRSNRYELVRQNTL